MGTLYTDIVTATAKIMVFYLLYLGLSGPVFARHFSEQDFLEIAAPLVSKWEGKENRAYLDQIADPPVWTVCYGETRDVVAGDYYTDEECIEQLENALLNYRSDLHQYFNCETVNIRLPATRDAAYTSLAYNIGIRAAGRSTATRRLNAGDIVGGCQAIGWWNRAGQRVVRGLVNRRTEEVQLCLKGDTWVS